ncbi:MAG: acyl-CoA dehydrogenase family protein, partial [Helicobacteraceae bacterium]|nr:acyl-CoA dehydrogenase family protein [Helicobacteraceae bacterium]
MGKVLSFDEALKITKALNEDFAKTVVERDREAKSPKYERNAIRKSGLLTFFIAKELGGSGGSWEELLAIIREFSRVDSSIGHLYAFHNYQLATVRLYGEEKQWRELHKNTVERGWFWGNALNRISKSVVATKKADGSYEWNGTASFATGAKDADYLTITGGENSAEGKSLVAAIPANRAGITINDDWDNVGQRRTDSGTLTFKDVQVSADEILSDPGPFTTPFSSARALIGQLVFANIFLSIAEGAFETGLNYLRGKNAKPWLASFAPSAQKDPFILRHIGDLFVKLEGARALTEKANAQIDPLWQKAESLSQEERGKFAVSVATAKVAATQVGLDLTNRIFEPLGARSTASVLGLDRFWRNLRTQTLHDPVDYKIYALGDWTLNGTL